MFFTENLKSAFQNVISNKMRSFLTMLGIIIGISSVITIVSLGQGGKNYLTGEFERIGTNVVNIGISSPENVDSGDYFTMDDVKSIKDRIGNVDAVVPSLGTMGTLKTESKSKQVSVTATTNDYTRLMKIDMVDGRFLTERDIENAVATAVIDDTLAEKLFNRTNVVGEKVTLTTMSGSVNLTIGGVIKNPAGSLAAKYGDNMPGYVFVPIPSSQKLMPNARLGHLSVILKDMSISSETSSKIIRLLDVRHNTKDKYSAEEGFKELDTINDILNMFTAVIGAIAGISLLVGGIGVMNIMLVSVTERTREIGIRKALGATMKDIRLQFLIESLILCLFGGTIGMVLGISVGALIAQFIDIVPAVSINVVIISFLFSSGVGIFFGSYPANKAAKLDPIEALRYE